MRTVPNDHHEKWRLILFDMKDSVNQQVTLDLQGIHVRFYFVSVKLSGTLTEMEKLISKWETKLKKAKRASV
jgi:hypothetical protein